MTASLPISTFTDPRKFLAALTPLRASYPERSTLLNTVLHNHIAAPYSGRLPAMIDPAVTDQRVVAAALADSIRAIGPVLDTISGHPDAAPVFLGARSELNGAVRGQSKSLLLHRLASFTPPADVVGMARNADEHSTSARP